MTASIERMLSDLAQARETMIDTLDQMTKRGENLELISARSNDLSAFTASFSARVHERTGNRRLRILLGVILLFVLLAMGVYLLFIFERETKFAKQ